jgi:hypothetical protein
MKLRHRRRAARARPPEEPLRRTALLDAAHSAYADWRAESLAVERLYVHWRDATRDERSSAFAAYAAALEREERAAVVYADLIGMAATYLGPA